MVTLHCKARSRIIQLYFITLTYFWVPFCYEELKLCKAPNSRLLWKLQHGRKIPLDRRIHMAFITLSYWDESHLNFNLFIFFLNAVGIPLQVTPQCCYTLDLTYTLLWKYILKTLIKWDRKREGNSMTVIKLILQYLCLWFQSCNRNNAYEIRFS
jgi:hypothetical protein